MIFPARIIDKRDKVPRNMPYRNAAVCQVVLQCGVVRRNVPISRAAAAAAINGKTVTRTVLRLHFRIKVSSRRTACGRARVICAYFMRPRRDLRHAHAYTRKIADRVNKRKNAAARVVQVSAAVIVRLPFGVLLYNTSERRHRR